MKTLILVLLCRALLAQDPVAGERHEFIDRRTFERKAAWCFRRRGSCMARTGSLNADRSNAVLLPSHYMANFHGYEWLIGPGQGPRSGEAVSRRDGVVRQRQFLVAQQHARAVPRAALPGDDHSRQRGGCPPVAHRSSRDHAPAGRSRLLDGRAAGLSVGRELSGLYEPDSGHVGHGQDVRAWHRAAGGTDCGPYGRSGVSGRRLYGASRARVWKRSEWCGPRGSTRRSGGGVSYDVGTTPGFRFMLSVRPLRSTGVTPLLRYYGPLRLPAGPLRGYVFPLRVGRFPLPPGRVSQAPRLIFPRALPPTTPEGPTAACACCFPTGCQASS